MAQKKRTAGLFSAYRLAGPYISFANGAAQRAGRPPRGQRRTRRRNAVPRAAPTVRTACGRRPPRARAVRCARGRFRPPNGPSLRRRARYARRQRTAHLACVLFSRLARRSRTQARPYARKHARRAQQTPRCAAKRKAPTTLPDGARRKRSSSATLRDGRSRPPVPSAESAETSRGTPRNSSFAAGFTTTSPTSVCGANIFFAPAALAGRYRGARRPRIARPRDHLRGIFRALRAAQRPLRRPQTQHVEASFMCSSFIAKNRRRLSLRGSVACVAKRSLLRRRGSSAK